MKKTDKWLFLFLLDFGPQVGRVELIVLMVEGFLAGSDSKESACNSGDLGSIPGSGRFPGEGHGNPLRYSSLENSMNTGAWWAKAHAFAKWGCKESNMIE